MLAVTVGSCVIRYSCCTCTTTQSAAGDAAAVAAAACVEAMLAGGGAGMPVEGPQDAVLGPAGCTEHAVWAVPVVEAVSRELPALLLALPLRALGLCFLTLLVGVHSCKGDRDTVGIDRTKNLLFSCCCYGTAAAALAAACTFTSIRNTHQLEK
jgi:hypothetical protein